MREYKRFLTLEFRVLNKKTAKWILTKRFKRVDEIEEIANRNGQTD